MVRDHPQGGAVRVAGAGHFARGIEQQPEQVDLVVAVHMLHHRGDALEPHAGIDRGFWQRRERAIGGALVLHEDQVPDLDKAVAVLVRAAGWSAGHLRAVIVENLGARSAGTGIAHGPEIGFLAEAGNPGRVHADLLDPDPLGLLVILEHRHPQALARQLQHPGQEFPAVADRLGLEVIAEAEIAEHFEKGVMARGVADVVEVVVLAAGPHTALRAGGTGIGALLAPEKQVLELHHAGIGEQQRRVIARHQRTAGHARVSLALEVCEERFPDFRTVHAINLPQPARCALPAGPGAQKGQKV